MVQKQRRRGQSAADEGAQEVAHGEQVHLADGAVPCSLQHLHLHHDQEESLKGTDNRADDQPCRRHRRGACLQRTLRI